MVRAGLRKRRREEAIAAAAEAEASAAAKAKQLKKEKRRRTKEDLGGTDAGNEDDTEGAAKKKKWKSVELDLEMLKEFESSGGVFIEEAGEDDIGIAYGDGRVESLTKTASEVDSSAKKRKKKRQAKRSEDGEIEKEGETTDAVTAEALSEENERLKRELAEMKAKHKKAEQEVEEKSVMSSLPDWLRFELHPALMRGLAGLGFQKPTEVQARSLEPAIRQRKDIVGAAETGSGKTLAFGLPILHHTLQEMDRSSATVDVGATGSSSSSTASAKKELRALVILPTRELAVQVRSHICAVSEGTGIQAECVVGGMSMMKQKRLLKKCPTIVVGTPGRIFALLGLGKDAEEERCDWLRDSVRGLRHLVLDEADRLVEAGHFRELDRILGHVYNSLERAQQLQTFVFSATLTMDPTNRKKPKGGEEEDNSKVAQLMRRLNFREARAVHIVDLTSEEGKAASSAGAAENSTPSGASTEAKPAVNGVVRQLPERLRFWESVASDDKDREGLLAMWLLRRFRWEPAAVPFGSAQQTPDSRGGAPETKDIGNTSGNRGGGRVVIFVNAITMVMRLAPCLSLLLESPDADKVLSRVRMKQDKDKDKIPGPKVDVIGLHSKMRQKERLKKMERFRRAKDAVLICTDIAARGLDVKDVAAVLHFQAPRGVEVFVHRSGRTARAGKDGDSIAFMAPKDAAEWGKLYRAAGISKAELRDIGQTSHEVAAAKEGMRLAAELESKVHKMAKEHQDLCWFKKTADEAELIFDEDEDDREAAKAAAPRKQLYGLYRQLVARVRRPPKRVGGGPQAGKLGGRPLRLR